MTILLASDLDRTLIYSASAFWLDTPDHLAPPLGVVEVYNGAPLSFMTREAERLLVELGERTTFVPATTRTPAQYRRVRLPGPPPAFAITSNGGVILVDGEPDPAWSELVRSRGADATAPLPAIEALLTDPACAAWVLRVHVADELFVYAIVDRAAVPGEWLLELEERCDALGWSVSLQGRKLYCVPTGLTKGAAVEEVRRRLGATTVLAAGDSLLDEPMLEIADRAFRPAHGELHDAGYEAAHLTVTSGRGVLAGEELVRLMADAVVGIGSPAG